MPRTDQPIRCTLWSALATSPTSPNYFAHQDLQCISAKKRLGKGLAKSSQSRWRYFCQATLHYIKNRLKDVYISLNHWNKQMLQKKKLQHMLYMKLTQMLIKSKMNWWTADNILAQKWSAASQGDSCTYTDKSHPKIQLAMEWRYSAGSTASHKLM